MALPSPRSDRTALVTGASSGIGEEIARQLADRGYGITLIARRADRLQALAEELRRRSVRVEVMPLDLADRVARSEVPARLAERDLRADVLVNNAGVSTLGAVARAEPADELHMLEVDVAAVVDLCTRLLPAMVAQGRGAVLNVASTAAFQPLPGQAGYAASKAFVLSYTRSLAGELRGTGVTATALCPGPVDTGFGEAAGFDADEAKAALPSFLWETPEAVARCGIEAMARGRTVAIPGPANRASATFAHLVPKSLLVPLLARRHPGLKPERAGGSAGGD